MSREPEVGDIWYNHMGKYHYLILADDTKMGMGNVEGYTMLILEKNIIDSAYLPHFEIQCNFVK